MSSSLINDRNKKNIRPNISVRLEMYKLYTSIYDTLSTLWSERIQLLYKLGLATLETS